jgi:large subunit ribosomal protein L24
MRMKIRKGDTVEVISGRLEDKGKRGEVITVMNAPVRIVVQGVNIRTKHQRQMQTQAGRQIKPGRIQFEAPVDISNVMLVCPKCGKAARVGIQRDEGGAHRVCKNCDQLID